MEAVSAVVQPPGHSILSTSTAFNVRLRRLPCRQLWKPRGQPALRYISSVGSTRAKPEQLRLSAAARAASEPESPAEHLSRKEPVRGEKHQLEKRHLDRRQLLLVASSLISASTGLEHALADTASDTYNSAANLNAVTEGLDPVTAALSFFGSNAGRRLLKLNFFLQEDPSSSYFVVPPLEGYGGNFGALVVIDQAITVSPAPSSAQIGRARGLAVFAHKATVPGPELVWTAEFNDPRPSGYGTNSLSLRGYNGLGQEEREVAIVGGTGLFRLAKGWAILRTYSRDSQTRLATTSITAFVQTAADVETSPSSYKPW